MKIIDAHMHFSNITTFKACARHTSLLDYSGRGYRDEADANHIVRSVCMGLAENSPASFPDASVKTPMTADLAECLPVGMSLCLGINPHTLTGRSIQEMDELIAGGGIAGLKIYAGYYHFDVSDPIYEPVYRLALKHDLTVAIHTGDTYSERGLLIYSHPLNIDRLAVSMPDLRIVICHMGVPWIFDACQVAYKNRNVYLDLSGLLVGSAEYISEMSAKRLLLDRYRQALVFMDNFEKILFGTDWPLAPMGAYIGFCKELVPPEAYDLVFYQNAADVYRVNYPRP